MSVPILLAVAGTGLMAVAIFVPFRGPDRDSIADDGPGAAPHWPQLVEPTATACDVGARLDLVDALASLRSPWALDVLHSAGDEETDPDVRAAIAVALAPAAGGSLIA